MGTERGFATSSLVWYKAYSQIYEHDQIQSGSSADESLTSNAAFASSFFAGLAVESGFACAAAGSALVPLLPGAAGAGVGAVTSLVDADRTSSGDRGNGVMYALANATDKLTKRRSSLKSMREIEINGEDELLPLMTNLSQRIDDRQKRF